MKKLYLGWKNQNALDAVSQEVVVNQNEIEVGVVSRVINRSVCSNRDLNTNAENRNMSQEVREKAQSSKVTMDEVQDMITKQITELERRLKDDVQDIFNRQNV